MVLQNILDHFNTLDDGAREEVAAADSQVRRGTGRGSASEQLRQVEGSVLLHINFAMKQDQVHRLAVPREARRARHAIAHRHGLIASTAARAVCRTWHKPSWRWSKRTAWPR